MCDSFRILENFYNFLEPNGKVEENALLIVFYYIAITNSTNSISLLLGSINSKLWNEGWKHVFYIFPQL